MSKVLVTGGSGFLGSHVADALSAKGFDVVIFDKRISNYIQPGQKMIVGDMLDAEIAESATQGCDYIFHAAALADLNEARNKPVDTVRLNILGTVNFLEAARKFKVKRFVFASTVYVYSREGGFYRCSKQSCEAYIEEYFRRFGLEYTILRYGSLYGPRADQSNGVYRLLLHAVTNRYIRHIGNPDDAREYIHVEDATRLSVEALENKYANQHLVITGHYPMRLKDLFTMFSEIIGNRLDIEYIESPSHHSHYKVTPYAYNPSVGRKLTSNYYVDMGQGILQILDQLYQEGRISSENPIEEQIISKETKL
jgi:UDP-glucose 4-epimerase